MNDLMDDYLSRCMKNWAARHSPPREGRRQLLQVAASLPYLPPSWLPANLYSSIKNRLSHPWPSPYVQPRWVADPITQSRVWSFQLATTWRMAN